MNRLGTSSNAPGFTVATDATLSLVPGNFKYLVGYLTNAGVTRLTGNTTLYLNNNPYARLVNLPGGLVDSTGGDLFEASGTGGGVIENRGTFRKSGGADSAISASLVFTNIATVDVRANVLEIRNGWHVGGTYLGTGVFNKLLFRYNLPDKARSGLVGMLRLFKHFSGVEFILLPKRISSHPQATNANH